jgi:hypothetical protein
LAADKHGRPMQHPERHAGAHRVSAALSTPVVSDARTSSGQVPPKLLLEHFFDLSDLFLYFAGVFFGVAFGL